MKNFLKQTKYFLQAIPIFILYGFLRLLPLDVSSALGAKVMSFLGPRIKASKIARINLRLAFPEKSEEEITKIILGMWNNLGRVLGEFPHLPRIEAYADKNRVEVIGEENAWPYVEQKVGGIIFSAHLGNWEILSLLSTARNVPVHRIYRPSNNPFVDRLVVFSRRSILGDLLPKGRIGARKCIEHLREKEFIGMLIDQKLNKGVSTPFFGHIAKTAPALAEFGYRYNCPLIPTRVERLEGARFRVTVYPPIELPDTGDKTKNLEIVMTNVNRQLEEWIRERPEQWLWIHRRWPKEHYKK